MSDTLSSQPPPPESIEAKARRQKELIDGFARSINASSFENGSNTPDFILAEYLHECLGAFDRAVNERSRWYGRNDLGAGVPNSTPPTPAPAPVNTANQFAVSAVGGGDELARVKVIVARFSDMRMTHEEAANLAAYLVALGPGRERFLEVLDAVERT